MIQKWRKLGRIFCPSGETEWMKTHAAVPIAEHVEGDIFRIYFSSRDLDNRSFTGCLLLDIKKPNKIISLSSNPVLKPGWIGEFDDSGAMATWLCSYKGKKYLYYIGWNLGVTVPFRNSIGLAIDDNKGKFCRFARGPVLDRTPREPHFTASCCVIPGDDKWRMWYLSCTEWLIIDGKVEHRYHIKYAESKDGLSWDRRGHVAIDFASSTELAISRPSVIWDDGKWKMWYSYRGDSYRIGYAESQDGISWTRIDSHCGIDVSTSGWDSEMIEYPFVFDHGGKKYMLYNGNGYGRTGFGLAVLENSEAL
ncbi:hypothetical protein BZG06_15700 [Salinivibrio kushneri]|uniref:hypothetical protein n=1 Tax=Salinivibrio kushneri TaxID=1908198 RepID=UPI0009885E09|nr:hypothetical protein [Salinivibrio kushneri]OOE39543.1 hypothetical protein BZG06_15700 [Salinivibrio kushneri]